MMDDRNEVVPLVELTRGGIIESVHFGAVAVVTADGRLVARAGDPDLVAFLRSTSKPLQAIPLVETGAAEAAGFGSREIAIACGSHAGMDVHTTLVAEMLARLGLTPSALLCGVQPPLDAATEKALVRTDSQPTSLHHNCSGKHAGMLAGVTWLHHQGIESAMEYINPAHPLQERIRTTWAEMAGLSPEKLVLGIDGCSAPNYALPLRNAAWSLARLADPSDLPARRADACRQIFAAMTQHPELVSGDGGFDTELMRVGAGRWIAKGGAEGYHGLALAPGVLGPNSPAVGIALKVGDGDYKRARPVAASGVLYQLGVLTETDLATLGIFAGGSLKNWREVVVGEIRSALQLEWEEPL